MENALILETTFLIDLERELGRGGDGSAQRFLKSHATCRLFITPTISGSWLPVRVSPTGGAGSGS